MRQAVKERMTEIVVASGGALSLDAILHEARKEDSPLHAEFEWDLSAAHEIYLKDQARRLVRQFYTEIQTSPDKASVRIREYVSLPIDAFVDDDDDEPRASSNSRLYYPTVSVFSDSTKRHVMLAEALRDLNGLRRRYEHLTELANVFEALDEVTEEVVPKKTRAPKASSKKVKSHGASARA